MSKMMSAACDPQLHAAHAMCMAVGETTAADALVDGAAAGIPWQDLLKGFITLALPVFIKWVQDWLAGNPTPLPTPNSPSMP